jgi:hypothetical protein
MNDESAAELSREELIALVAALRAHIAELEPLRNSKTLPETSLP